MGYTWSNGDLITADRLNNTGGKSASLIVEASGFGNYSHSYGEVLIAKWNDSRSQWEAEYQNGLGSLYWVGSTAFFWTPTFPVPNNSSYKLFWVVYGPTLSDVDVTFDGDISSSPITVYTDNGTYGQYGYEITGNAYITLVAT